MEAAELGLDLATLQGLSFTLPGGLFTLLKQVENNLFKALAGLFLGFSLTKRSSFNSLNHKLIHMTASEPDSSPQWKPFLGTTNHSFQKIQ